MNSKLLTDLSEAIHSHELIAGHTHEFYRYPARFSPLFARAAIKAFTKPGDVVLDPFMGGGTAIVEARALGRRAVGADINSLAVFVSKAKTTLLSEVHLLQVYSWANKLISDLNLRHANITSSEWAKLGYQRHIDGRSTWPIRKTLELALAHVSELQTYKQQRLARCALLKTAQWALDCRTHIPSASEFRQQFSLYLGEMLEAAREYGKTVKAADRLYGLDGTFRLLCLCRSAIGIESDGRIINKPAPALILTSPPYPGVHVLYHRWQIRGRKETPAPFWIVNSLDGSGASHYTFGDRKQANLTAYFQQAQSAFGSLAQVADSKTIVVQMIAFSDPSWQLPEYLRVMGNAGFHEIKYSALSNSNDGRIWRTVPHRKWYATQQGPIATDKEVVLFHRLS